MTTVPMSTAKRIVVIDDDPMVSEMVATTLSNAGYRIDVVADGSDAMDAIYEAETDLVILDCNLPGRPGMVVLDDIRRSAALQSLPVVMLTGRTSDWHAKVALNAGASAYLKKPFDPAELTVVVTKLLSGIDLANRVS